MKEQRALLRSSMPYGEIPISSADAYDAIHNQRRIEKANVTPDMSISDICEKLKKAMTEISVDGLQVQA